MYNFIDTMIGFSIVQEGGYMIYHPYLSLEAQKERFGLSEVRLCLQEDILFPSDLPNDDLSNTNFKYLNWYELQTPLIQSPLLELGLPIDFEQIDEVLKDECKIAECSKVMDILFEQFCKTEKQMDETDLVLLSPIEVIELANLFNYQYARVQVASYKAQNLINIPK